MFNAFLIVTCVGGGGGRGEGVGEGGGDGVLNESF